MTDSDTRQLANYYADDPLLSRPYPPTCRERQDAEILALQMTCRELQATINHLTHIIEDILTHVSTLEAAQNIKSALLGAETWDFQNDPATITWTADPPPLYTPGCEEETP